MRLLLVTQALSGGGAERIMGRMAEEAVRRYGRVDAVTLSTHAPYSQWRSEGIRVSSPVTRARYLPWALVSEARRLCPDVIFSSVARVNFAVLAVRAFLGGAGVVVREAYSPRLAMRTRPHPLLHTLGYRLLYPRSNAVICQSPDMAEELRSHFGVPSDRLRLIPNPSPSITEETLAGMVSPYGGGAGMRICAVGRLVPQKDPETLLRAFAELPASLDASLYFVGDGPLRSQLEALTVTLGVHQRVRFPGWVDDPLPWMAHADVFCLPSVWEGFSNSLMEALACGTPAVVSDCPGGSSDVVRPGVNGFLFETSNVGQLRDYLIDLLSSPPEPTQVRATIEQYQEAAVWEQYFDLMECVAGGRG